MINLNPDRLPDYLKKISIFFRCESGIVGRYFLSVCVFYRFMLEYLRMTDDIVTVLGITPEKDKGGEGMRVEKKLAMSCSLLKLGDGYLGFTALFYFLHLYKMLYDRMFY